MVVLSYSVIYYIYIPGTLGPCFHYWCSVYGICKWSDTLWPVGRVRLFADYTISLSSLCRLIWKHWTTKMLVRYMMPSVCLRLRQFSQLSLYSLYGAVSSAYPILLWWSRECVLYLIIIIKPEVWIINHCLGLGHETMVCAVCLTMFLPNNLRTADFLYNKTRKTWHRHIFYKFLKSLPQWHCDKKASIENPWEQSVIVTSQLPAAGSCVDDVTMGQHFEITGSSDGIKCWFMSLKAH